MTNALHVMTKGMSFRSCTHDKNVAGAHAALEAPIKHHSIDETPKAERHHHQAQGNGNYAAGNVIGVKYIESAREQKTGSKASLNREPLLVQVTAKPGGRIDVQPPAGND